jgi:hypothetical protein
MADKSPPDTSGSNDGPHSARRRSSSKSWGQILVPESRARKYAYAFTDNVHCHWAIASVNRRSKAWNRQDNWFRLHKALREMELKCDMQVEHGLATVRDFGLPTQRIEKATKAERLAWGRNAGSPPSGSRIARVRSSLTRTASNYRRTGANASSPTFARCSTALKTAARYRYGQTST